ncbi:MAG: nitric oxide reductase activation protein NorD [Nitrosomonadales bacterium]|nr:nitric oxide reductase activation protein NorD [Nitrosomonadales bacterium]
MKAVLDRLATGLKNYLSSASRQELPAEDDAREQTRFTDVQRRLRIYLRALWDCDFIVQQSQVESGEDAASQPFIEHFRIHLPEVFYARTTDGGRRVTGLEIYRAAAAHAACHLIYTEERLSARSLDKWQIAMISAIEDARVEALAIRRFPGLKRLWAMQHTATPQDNPTAGNYLARLARALLDENYPDDDPWVVQARALFNAANPDEQQISLSVGLKLADSFRAKRIKFHAHSDAQDVPYRDDNRFLWRRRGEPLEVINPYFMSQSTVGIEEEGNKDPRKRPMQILDTAEDGKAASGTFFYPEWNYRNRTEDLAWVTLREREPEAGDLKIIDAIVAQNGPLISRMKALLRAIRDGAAHRARKLEVGDEIDINAAVRAQTDMRMGLQPDPRIMMRSIRKTRDISVLMLLDLSRSMNEKVQEREHTALQLTQQSSVLFAEAIAAVGDPFAIHGFYSDSRHFVEYFRMKDFGQPWDDGPKASIAGMTGRRGTRMGAAIRHATHHLNEQKSSKKLLLILTDGEPSDVDSPDRQYLHDDTKKSVEDAKRNGIHTYCISLDPAADRYVSRIFGAMNYMVVDHVKCLPEKVLLIYAGLTR